MTTSTDAVTSWLAINDPRHARTLSSFFAGATPLLQTGNAPPIVSSAAVTGPRAAQDINETATLDQLKGTADGQALFRSHPMLGCTSVMTMAQIAAGYDPTAGFSPDTSAKYLDYVRRLGLCPFFVLEMTDQVKIERQSDDYTKLISDVADAFDGIEAQDKDKIKTSLTSIVNAAASHSETASSEDLFVQNVLFAGGGDGAPGTYTVYIYSSHVSMIMHENKGHNQMQSDYSVLRTQLKFRAEEWPQFADKVWNMHVASVDDWLNGNSTPTGTKKADLCLTPR